ncbi:MAG TPA: hypothetical protein ENK43_08245 [Planctomycetes bacterium]|nr:hypothetical protein [Planctomycetota bacterium]
MRLPASIVTAALFLVSGLLSAQSPFHIRIVTEQDGFYEVAGRDVVKLTEGRPLLADRLVLRKNGKSVPILLRNLDGNRFTRRSRLLFYGEAGRNGHTTKSSYELVYGSDVRRIRETRYQPRGETRDDALVTRTFEEDLLYEPWASTRVKAVDAPHAHWYWRRLTPPKATDDPAATAAFSLDLRQPLPLRVRGALVRFKLKLDARLAATRGRALEIRTGARVLDRIPADRLGNEEVTVRAPVEAVSPITLLTLTLIDENPGDGAPPSAEPESVLVDTVQVTWPAALTGPTSRQRQIIYDLALGDEPIEAVFRPLGVDAFQVYAPATGTLYTNMTVPAAPDRNTRFIVTDGGGYLHPTLVTAWSARDLRKIKDGGDWVAVTLPRFAPVIRPLADLRRRQGLHPLVVTSREVYDAFGHGDFDPEAITRFLAHAEAAWQVKPRFLLLVGDADLDRDGLSSRATLPTRLVPTLYNGLTASDRALLPPQSSVAVGRLPFRRADILARWVTRAVRYETNAPQGAWRRRLQFVAGEGRFGKLADGLIERFALTTLSRLVPSEFDIAMTYARKGSPYYLPPSLFHQRAVEQFNEGPLLYTYIGHGRRRAFDSLRIEGRRVPILGPADLKSLDAGDRPPLLTVIACSTAWFDDPKEDSIAEKMLRLSGGPIAAIGATRISHPYANAFFGKSLLGPLLIDRRPLGEALLNAQNSLTSGAAKGLFAALAKFFLRGVDEARLLRDHRHLYVLLGDPATHLALPDRGLTLEAAKGPQGPTITGHLPPDSGVTQVSVQLCLPPDVQKPVPAETPASARSRYRLANDKVLWTAVFPVTEGTFTFPLPPRSTFPPGPLLLKALATSPTHTFTSSLPL